MTLSVKPAWYEYIIITIQPEGDRIMTKHIHQSDDYCHEYFEYHGSTAIVRVRKYPRNIVVREWIYFDSVEDAMEYFNSEIG